MSTDQPTEAGTAYHKTVDQAQKAYDEAMAPAQKAYDEAMAPDPEGLRRGDGPRPRRPTVIPFRPSRGTEPRHPT